MTLLRWILLAGLAFVFLLLAVSNWTDVRFILPAGDPVTVPLPILLGTAFAAGWLPTWLLHLGARAGWKRRLAKVEASGSLSPTPTPTPAPATAAPSLAQPIIVPPAGA